MFFRRRLSSAPQLREYWPGRLCLLLVLAIGNPVLAANADLELQVKTGLLFRFLQFTTWPPQAFADPGSPLQVCVTVGHAWNGKLDALESRLVGGHPIRIMYSVPAERLPGCHAVVIDPVANSFKRTLNNLHNLPVLTVSDDSNFIAQGGMIGFVRVGDTVKFSVNLTTTRAAGLNLNANMLVYAYEVRQ